MSTLNNKVNDTVNNDDGLELYNNAKSILAEYSLSFTFRSINYIINKEGVSFGQLRSCVYKLGNDYIYDYIRSTMTLIKAGLIGSNQVPESQADTLDSKAYSILEDWRTRVGSIGLLHVLIIELMEDKHFFIGEAEMGIIGYMSSKGLLRDLTSNLIKEDLEERVRQLEALNLK